MAKGNRKTYKKPCAIEYRGTELTGIYYYMLLLFFKKPGKIQAKWNDQI